MTIIVTIYNFSQNQWTKTWLHNKTSSWRKYHLSSKKGSNSLPLTLAIWIQSRSMYILLAFWVFFVHKTYLCHAQKMIAVVERLWHCGVVVISTAQLYSIKPELRLFRFKSCFQHVRDLWWSGSLTVVVAGNNAKCLPFVIEKIIHLQKEPFLVNFLKVLSLNSHPKKQDSVTVLKLIYKMHFSITYL